MKKIMNIFVLVAAAAMALASCQTQEMEDPTPKEYEYIFEIGNADEEDTPETSATLGDTCVEWEEVDQIGVYTDGQNGVSYNRYGNVTLGSTVTFTISSYYALVAGDMVHCYYPYVKTNSQDPKTVELSIPTSQTEKNQMPMVSLPYAVTEALDEKTDSDKSSGEIKFANLGSVIEFHVYSTTAAYQSEKITSVTFNADQAIAGDFEFDLTAVNYSNEETLEISGYTEKSVVATLATPVAVPATRETAKVVKIVVAPGSYTGNVVVATDKAIYTYPITSAKNFQRSVVMPLGLNLRENVREALVASTATLSSEEIKTTIAASKCAYGAEVVYDDALDGVVWKSTCLTDAAGRPWLQMKSDKTVYIAIESDGNIEEVVVTVTSASNSSEGVLDISKHETFTGTLSLNTAADGSGTNVASGEATDNIVTLVPNSANKTLYLKTNAGARVEYRSKEIGCCK